MSDWTFEQKNGFQYVIKDVLVKVLTKERL